MKDSERDHKQRGEVEGEADSPLSREPDVGLNPKKLGSCLSWRLNRMSHPGTLIYCFCFFFFKINLFMSERERVWAGGRGKGKGEKECSSRLATDHGAWCNTQSQDPEIMPFAKTKSQVLNQLSHPGAPHSSILLFNNYSHSLFFPSFPPIPSVSLHWSN